MAVIIVNKQKGMHVASLYQGGKLLRNGKLPIPQASAHTLAGVLDAVINENDIEPESIDQVEIETSASDPSEQSLGVLCEFMKKLGDSPEGMRVFRSHEAFAKSPKPWEVEPYEPKNCYEPSVMEARGSIDPERFEQLRGVFAELKARGSKTPEA